jgi:alpha-D-xyloside xylohydrolase
VLSLEPFAQNIIHVRFAADKAWSNPYNSCVINKPVHLTWTVDEVSDGWVLKTGALQARVRKRDGALSFLDKTGEQVLCCSRRARRHADLRLTALDPLVQAFDTETPLYGLDQHQNGMLDFWGPRPGQA